MSVGDAEAFFAENLRATTHRPYDDAPLDALNAARSHPPTMASMIRIAPITRPVARHARSTRRAPRKVRHPLPDAPAPLYPFPRHPTFNRRALYTRKMAAPVARRVSSPSR